MQFFFQQVVNHTHIRRVILILGGAMLTVAGMLWLIVTKAYDYLAPHIPIEQPDAVVIEAWIPHYALSTIVSQLKSSPESQVILVGGERNHNYFTLGKQRTPGLTFHPGVLYNEEIYSDSVEIKAAGTYVAKGWGKLEVSVNGSVVGETFVNGTPKTYHFPTLTSNLPIESVSIKMSNAYTSWMYPKKREIWVYNLKINNRILSPFNNTVIYGFRNFNLVYSEERQFTKQTEFTACLLEEMGIPKERIIQLLRKENHGSRTYRNAETVAKWINKKNANIHSVNVYSQAAHTRRSYNMYRHTLGSDIAIGAIALRHKLYHRDWWKSSEGRKLMTQQMIKYLISKSLFHLVIK